MGSNTEKKPRIIICTKPKTIEKRSLSQYLKMIFLGEHQNYFAFWGAPFLSSVLYLNNPEKNETSYLNEREEMNSHCWNFPKKNIFDRNVKIYFNQISIYLSTNLSIYLSIYLSTHLSVHPSIHTSIYSYFHLSILPSIHTSIYPTIYLSIFISIYESTHLASNHQSIQTFIHLFTRTIYIHTAIHYLPIKLT